MNCLVYSHSRVIVDYWPPYALHRRTSLKTGLFYRWATWINSSIIVCVFFNILDNVI